MLLYCSIFCTHVCVLVSAVHTIKYVSLFVCTLIRESQQFSQFLWYNLCLQMKITRRLTSSGRSYVCQQCHKIPAAVVSFSQVKWLRYYTHIQHFSTQIAWLVEFVCPHSMLLHELWSILLVYFDVHSSSVYFHAHNFQVQFSKLFSLLLCRMF